MAITNELEKVLKHLKREQRRAIPFSGLVYGRGRSLTRLGLDDEFSMDELRELIRRNGHTKYELVLYKEMSLVIVGNNQ
ncbi:hypothetical protein RyT2_24240 [Pseudolactococcus yaeyamensis]